MVDTGGMTRATTAGIHRGRRPLPAVGVVTEDWTGDALFHEYSAAVDPLRVGAISPVPLRRFPAALHASGPTRAIVLDLSDVLGVDVPATGPSLLAQFLRIEPGESLATAAVATSELVYCLHGRGRLEVDGVGAVDWRSGDVITLPARCRARYTAGDDAVLYHVDDSPLLRYLGVEPTVLPVPAHLVRRRRGPGPAGGGGGRARGRPAQPGGGPPRQRRQRPDADGHPYPVGHARACSPTAPCSAPTVTRASPSTSSSTADPAATAWWATALDADGAIIDARAGGLGDRWRLRHPARVCGTATTTNRGRRPTSCPSRTPDCTPTCGPSTSASAGKRARSRPGPVAHHTGAGGPGHTADLAGPGPGLGEAGFEIEALQ